MPKNFGNNTFLGDVYLPSITTDKLLVVGQSGVVEGVDQLNTISKKRIIQTFTINQDIPINENHATSITMPKFYELLIFQCFVPVRLRIYNSQLNQQTDLERLVNPIFTSSVSGLIFEGITTFSTPVIKLSPAATGFNLDGSNTSYITLTNLSTTALSTFDLNLIYLPLEA